MMDKDTPLVQTLDAIPLPPWGEVTLLRVHTAGYKRLSWRQIWQAFSDTYPGRWGIEFFPPSEARVENAHVYYLWLLPEGWSAPAAMAQTVTYWRGLG